MEVEQVTSLISNVGFPIFVCIMMLRDNKELRALISNLTTNLSLQNETLKVVVAKVEKIEDKLNSDK